MLAVICQKTRAPLSYMFGDIIKSLEKKRKKVSNMRGISSLFILAIALSVKANPNTPTIKKDNLPANVAYLGCLV